ncbi:TIGR01458 family HAD-type hydrolase [Methanospirillum lacunae]|uniref:Haloacid dehalogenase-like hydrolase domain-containing protein 2 n=1 Tax=Methanospirillum lacunae TaxID=668570 RepID=A0A2V2N2K1_9EURY|nr:TIGR01458 family HAD-type hydrolase [Methanospirillum lacunae]PWR71956.1 TIGR01458 family HAD-type hydrolase [Methanospirillum lacunae]
MSVHAVLLDIDGTLFTGMNPLPGAAETIGFLQNQNIPYRFISNGTRRSKKTVLEKLQSLNLPVWEDQIFTPAGAVIQYLLSRGISSCTLLSTDDLKNDFRKAGISLVHDAHVVIIADAGDAFTYQSINQVFRQVIGGADLIALEKDRYWMDHDGLSLGAGPFVDGLEYASGKTALLMGKPSLHFFSEALSSMDAEPGNTLMVGDDILTDIGGSMACGIKGVLVKTGKFNEEVLAKSLVKPSHIIKSIADLPELIREP